MGWSIILEDENHGAISAIEVELEDLLSDQLDLNQYRLLKYLDPYGNTTFNHLQINDLILDLKKIGPNEKISMIIELANKCRNNLHTYLTFYGD